jgi:hypothetical protein
MCRKIDPCNGKKVHFRQSESSSSVFKKNNVTDHTCVGITQSYGNNYIKMFCPGQIPELPNVSQYRLPPHKFS